MIFRLARQGGPDPFMEVKAVLLVLGASLGITGMVNDRAWLVYLGIAVIAVGMTLRLLARRRAQRDERNDQPDE